LFKDYPSADDVITFSKNAVVRHYTGKKHKFPHHICKLPLRSGNRTGSCNVKQIANHTQIS